MTNPGPAPNGAANVEIALENIYGLFSVVQTLKVSTLDDAGASTLWGYSSGSTTRLLLTPASGGTTINGLDASDVNDGFAVLIVNQSTTDNLIFAHLASTSHSNNQFSNVNGGSVALQPYAASLCIYVVNKWLFV
jgi:hypothetical protein